AAAPGRRASLVLVPGAHARRLRRRAARGDGRGRVAHGRRGAERIDPAEGRSLYSGVRAFDVARRFHRGERRVMKWAGRAVFVGLVVALAWGAAGCGGRGAGAGTGGAAYQDPHPLPADTMAMSMAQPGVYGGRFVFGETAGPKTFNAMIAN